MFLPESGKTIKSSLGYPIKIMEELMKISFIVPLFIFLLLESCSPTAQRREGSRFANNDSFEDQANNEFRDLDEDDKLEDTDNFEKIDTQSDFCDHETKKWVSEKSDKIQILACQNEENPQKVLFRPLFKSPSGENGKTCLLGMKSLSNEGIEFSLGVTDLKCDHHKDEVDIELSFQKTKNHDLDSLLVFPKYFKNILSLCLAYSWQQLDEDICRSYSGTEPINCACTIFKDRSGYIKTKF